MRLERFAIHHLSLPLKRPWRTSAGTLREVETVLIEATAADGATAWAEACPLGLPIYLPETAAIAALTLERYFAPLLVGREFAAGGEVAAVLEPFRGNSFAKAAAEIAVWGLDATRRDLPLHTLLGGGDGPVAIGEAIGIEPPVEAAIERVRAASAAGFARCKVKIAPGWDVVPLSAIRAACPEARLAVDANGAYGRDDLAVFATLDQLDLDYIEQPFHWRDLVDHAWLQAQLRTPVCLDESLTCRHDAEAALRLGACRAVCLKPGRLGGLTATLAVHALCQRHGVPCYAGSMLETGVGAAINLAVATLPGCPLAASNFSSGRFLVADIVTPELAMGPAGAMVPARQSYLGRSVDKGLVKRHALASRTVDG